MNRRTALSVVLGAGVLIASASVAFAGATPAPKIVKTATLPSIGLSAFQEGLFPGVQYAPIPATPPDPASPQTQADRGVDLGGIGSDLFRAPGDSGTEFWMITDRGPNGENADGIRTFPAPWFTPTILHVKAPSSELQVLSAIPIVGGGPDGLGCDTPVGGLPNLSSPTPINGAVYDDAPLAYDTSTSPSVPYTQSGLDTEGLVRTSNGEFWFVEEYSPSLGHVNASGCVLERYVPNGLGSQLTTAGSPIIGDASGIPAIYQLRKKNRGFEALGLSPSGRYLFIGLQSPLSNPSGSAGNASLNTRILRFDLQDEAFDAEYVYRFQTATEYETGARSQDLKLSSIVALDDDTLLVNERTDLVAKVYLAELGSATNILGTWDCRGGSAKTFLGGVNVPACAGATNPPTLSLEQMSATDLASNAITSIAKPRLVVEIDSRSGLPQKIEGLAVINESQIAVANDNDFNVVPGAAGFSTTTGNMVLRSPAVPSQVIRIKLDQPIPIDW
jgi:hypothetical protein